MEGRRRRKVMIRTISALALTPSGSSPPLSLSLLMHVYAIDRYTYNTHTFLYGQHRHTSRRHQERDGRTPDVLFRIIFWGG